MMTMQPMMMPAETGDFEHVKQNPAAWYRLPQAILDDPNLRYGEKQALLTEWSRDLTDRSAAADEGMVPEDKGLIDRDVRMQAKVAEAQETLAAMEETEEMSFPERLWRRITG